MTNTLYPVFLQLEKLSLLIIGGGKVALEKLESVLANSPKTSIRLVAKEIIPEIKLLTEKFPNLQLHERAFEKEDFENAELAIVAVNSIQLYTQIRAETHHGFNLLVNVADKPDLCDFYLGSIVRKGNLKIAISTNGTSPTVAKRVREVLTETIPEEIDQLLDNMQEIRNHLKGDFNYKVKELNRLTTEYLHKDSYTKVSPNPEIENLLKIIQSVQKRANISLVIIGGFVLFAILGILIHEFHLSADIQQFLNKDNNIFYWMLLAGFLAEIVAGSMGKVYGVICTTILLLLNVPPPPN